MKKIVIFICLLITAATFAQTKTVKGKILLEGTPLKDVNIQILDSPNVVVSAKDGSYQIEASEGDIVQYSFVGLKTVQVVVEDITSILNISMYADINELDEVTVVERVKKVKIVSQQDYDENKTYLQTSFGMKDLGQLGGTVRFLQGEDIGMGARCILEAIRGVIPGVTVVGLDACSPNSAAIIRGPTSIVLGNAAIYDLDGVIFTEPPTWVAGFEIERIAVLAGLSTTTKYGSIGRNGVIVVNTKNRGNFLKNTKIDPSLDTARLTNNVFANDAVASVASSGYGSKYLDALTGAGNLETAKLAYEKNGQAVSGSYFFALDALEHFLNVRKDKSFAQKVLDDNAILFQNNPVALKSLAYIYDASGLYGQANEIYKEVFMLRPQYAQSYLDLARSYVAMGESQKAATMLLRYDYLVEEGFLNRDDNIANVTDRELNNLLQLKGRSLVSGKSKSKYVLEDGFKGTRLLFEWADSEAEFDLQFVNPENRYAKWEHTYNANPERIQQEKKLGYSAEEYLIDQALKGIWKVNVKYKGNKKLTPTYLKATIYYNYGSTSQSKEIKVFKLQSKGLNQNLFSIQNGTLLAAK